ncbi:MAG TPA: aldose 1-epimerase family protein [Solirubrobacteraceae bacterium]|jgi:aldose 1-epimerase
MTSDAPSGEQFELRCGEQRATIVEVGAGIRAYSVAGRDVLDPYPLDAICDGGHGAVLVPWPNRLGQGRYSFDGAERQLDLSEPARGNASHGLMRWRNWHAVEREAERVVMRARLNPHPGYPFALDLVVEYALTAQGLSVSCTATNVGENACPYGFGQHPYLSPGHDFVLDDCTLQLAATSYIELDDATLLPIATRPLEGSSNLNFNQPRKLGNTQIDAALTGLASESKARLTAPDGACVELWADESITVIQIFTGDTLAPARRRRALAVEPMSCPPDAFRSGEGLVRLEAGESHMCRWGVGLIETQNDIA